MYCMLTRANFNSKAADIGCSVFNLAQTIDIEKVIYIDDHMGKSHVQSHCWPEMKKRKIMFHSLLVQWMEIQNKS